ncbi:MAG TPA: ATP-binding protein [Polyangiales bacterium]|nr:ATP-binding protein [Polyangiales bacterium]
MSKVRNTRDERAILRAQAESRLRERPPKEQVDAGAADHARLMHELEVHEIELQLQNEELQEARIELEASLARYTELFEFAPIGYATLSAAGTIREINHTGAQLLGFARAVLSGKAFASFLVPAQRFGFGHLLDSALASERSHELDLELVRHDPKVLLKLTAVALRRDEPTVLIAFEDVTQRRSYQARLEASERQLREADRRKDEFLALLSHELRNPLAPIQSGLELLASIAPLSGDARRAWTVVDRQVKHLTRLVTDLLDVTRIRSGKIQLQRVRADLTELVRPILEDVRARFDARAVKLEAIFDAAQPLWVDADTARVTQVLSNLLSNAEKFTPRGGVVRVSVQAQGTNALLSILDTGIGIAAPYLHQVFEPFAQAPQSIDRARGGLGLGLSMVKTLVELHDGSVRIASPGPGRGTQVTVTLPLVEPPAAQPMPVQTSASPSLRRVFVIEDNHDTADTIRDLIHLLGHEAQVAYDGRSALERARTFRPDLVICDLGLPQMDGFEVARAFRAEDSTRHAFLVALSGYARPEDVQRATDAGFDMHLAKPASVEQLKELITRAPLAAARP